MGGPRHGASLLRICTSARSHQSKLHMASERPRRARRRSSRTVTGEHPFSTRPQANQLDSLSLSIDSNRYSMVLQTLGLHEDDEGKREERHL